MDRANAKKDQLKSQETDLSDIEMNVSNSLKSPYLQASNYKIDTKFINNIENKYHDCTTDKINLTQEEPSPRKKLHKKFFSQDNLNISFQSKKSSNSLIKGILKKEQLNSTKQTRSQKSVHFKNSAQQYPFDNYNKLTLRELCLRSPQKDPYSLVLTQQIK